MDQFVALGGNNQRYRAQCAHIAGHKWHRVRMPFIATVSQQQVPVNRSDKDARRKRQVSHSDDQRSGRQFREHQGVQHLVQLFQTGPLDVQRERQGGHRGMGFRTGQR